MFIKKETKEKLKAAWIDSSPFVVPAVAFLALMAGAYNKCAQQMADNDTALTARRIEALDHTSAAYVASLNEELKILREKN